MLRNLYVERNSFYFYSLFQKENDGYMNKIIKIKI